MNTNERDSFTVRRNVSNINSVPVNMMSCGCYEADSHGVGRGKHGQSRPCPTSLWTPSPRSSGSAWREVSPSSNRNLSHRAGVTTRGHEHGEERALNNDKLLVPFEKTALLKTRTCLFPGSLTRLLSDYVDVSITTSTFQILLYQIHIKIQTAAIEHRYTRKAVSSWSHSPG